jgi:hypothetical protein
LEQAAEIGWSPVTGALTTAARFLRENCYRHAGGIIHVETVCQRPSPNFR